jgi:hypothetical protein
MRRGSAALRFVLGWRAMGSSMSFVTLTVGPAYQRTAKLERRLTSNAVRHVH